MFVYSGDDTYESYRLAKFQAIKEAKSKNLDLKVVEEDEINSLNDFLYSLESIDIFGTSPFVFAKRVFNNKDVSTYFAENLDRLKNTNLIVWHDKKLDGKTKLYKTLSLNKLIKEFESPKLGEVKSWIKERSKELGIFIDEDALNFILANVSNDKWVIDHELQKLSTLEISKASLKDIKEIFGLTVKGDIWKFIDHVGYREKQKAIAEFAKLTAYEETTQLMISLLQREFRIMAQIIDAKGNQSKMSSIGLPSFIMKKTELKAKNFTLKEIREFVTRLFNLDFAIKTGEIDDKIGLTLFLLTL